MKKSASFSNQQNIQVKTIQVKIQQQIKQPEQMGIRALTALHDGTLACLISNDWGSEISLWELKTGQCIRTITSSEYYDHLTVSSDGTIVTIVRQGIKIGVWDPQTGKYVRNATSHAITFELEDDERIDACVEFSSGNFIGLCREFSHPWQLNQIEHYHRLRIKLWSKTGQTIDVINTDLTTVNYESYDQLTVLRNGTIVFCKNEKVSGEYHSHPIITIFNYQTRQTHTLPGGQHSRKFAELPDSILAVSSKDGGRIDFWNTQTLQPAYKTIVTSCGYILGALPNGILVTTDYKTNIKYWNVKSGQCINTIQGVGGGQLFIVLPDDTFACVGWQYGNLSITYSLLPTNIVSSTNNNTNNQPNLLAKPATNLVAVLSVGQFSVASTQGGLSIAYQSSQNSLTPVKALRELKSQLRNNNLIKDFKMINNELLIEMKDLADISQLQQFLEVEGILSSQSAFRPGSP